MDNLEKIVTKGPDAELLCKAYNVLMEAPNQQEQLLMASTLRRYLTRWLEISGTYGADKGVSYLASSPYFNPQLNKPLVLNELTLQALGKSRSLLEGELLDEAVVEYGQAESALRRFVHERPLERLKRALSSKTHRKEPFEALGQISREVSILTLITRQADYNCEEEGEVP